MALLTQTVYIALVTLNRTLCLENIYFSQKVKNIGYVCGYY